MNNIDIFDYSNAIDILIGMSDKQLQTLATKLVDRFPKTILAVWKRHQW